MSNEKTEIKSPKRGKQNGYSSATLHAKRDLKRKEAEARQAEYDSLTLKEKLAKAKSQRGNNAKLFKKLSKVEEKVKAPAVKTPPLTETQKAVKAMKRSKDAAEAAQR